MNRSLLDYARLCRENGYGTSFVSLEMKNMVPRMLTLTPISKKGKQPPKDKKKEVK